MNLNHLNLPCPRPAETAKFLAEHFAMSRVGGIGDRMEFLSDENGLLLALFQSDGESYPGGFHIGFTLDSTDAVNDMHRRLTDAGVAAPAPKKMHGSWTFYVQIPGGITVELQHYPA